MKSLKYTKIFNKIMFEGVWDELEEKKCFQRPSARFSFALHVFINSSIYQKHLYLFQNLTYVSEKRPKTNKNVF